MGILGRRPCGYPGKAAIFAIPWCNSDLDFTATRQRQLYSALTRVFAGDASIRALDEVIEREGRDLEHPNDLVTFLDNHDLPRFLSVKDDRGRLFQALVFLLTCRGIPCIYYGTEQYLHPPPDRCKDGGKCNDPYNRQMMESFSTNSKAVCLLQVLSRLRKRNPALAYGSMRKRWLDDDVYIYERSFGDSTVLVAINKSDSQEHRITGLRTSLLPGKYRDRLAGMLRGASLAVTTGSAGDHHVSDFVVPPGSVSVWSHVDEETDRKPLIGSVGPTVAHPGVRATVAGCGFGREQGTVLVGDRDTAVHSWSDTEITVTVPETSEGKQAVTVRTRDGLESPPTQLRVHRARLVPVAFDLQGAPEPGSGEGYYLVGNTLNLGDWDTSPQRAAGPAVSDGQGKILITASVPSGMQLEYQFIRVRRDGTVIARSAKKGTYAVPTTRVGRVSVTWVP